MHLVQSHRVATVLGRQRGEEGEVVRVVVGLVLAWWVLLVGQHLTTATTSVAKIGTWLVRIWFLVFKHDAMVLT